MNGSIRSRGKSKIQGELLKLAQVWVGIQKTVSERFFWNCSCRYPFDLLKQCKTVRAKISNPEPKLGRRLACGHMLTSTQPLSFCGAGRTWLTALLWRWTGAIILVSPVLVARCDRCSRNTAVTRKCLISTNNKKIKKKNAWILQNNFASVIIEKNQLWFSLKAPTLPTESWTCYLATYSTIFDLTSDH